MTVLQSQSPPAEPAFAFAEPLRREMDDRFRILRTEELIDAFHADVYRYAFWLTGCRASAEDVAQESFLRAYRGLHQLRDEGAVKGWLMTIVRNEYARWCRKLGPRSSADLSEDLEAEQDESQSLDNAEWVRRGLDDLPEEFRLVVLMFYFEQLTYAEIAQKLSLPIGTVMSRLSRGKKHLKIALERSEEPN